MAAFLAAASATSPASLNEASAAMPANLAVASMPMAALRDIDSAASPETLDAASPEIANDLLKFSPSIRVPKLESADALDEFSEVILLSTVDI